MQVKAAVLNEATRRNAVWSLTPWRHNARLSTKQDLRQLSESMRINVVNFASVRGPARAFGSSQERPVSNPLLVLLRAQAVSGRA